MAISFNNKANDLLQLLKLLVQRKIVIQCDESNLIIKDGKKYLDDRLVKKIKENKPELLSILQGGMDVQKLFNLDDGLNTYKASFAQKRFWVLYRLFPKSKMYNNIYRLSLKPGIAEYAFKEAVNKLFKKHDLLRSRFKVVREDLLLDISNKSIDEGIDKVYTSCDFDELDKYARDVVFDLEREWPIRVFVAGDTYTGLSVIIVIHHIVIDEESMNILFEDLIRLLKNESSENEIISDKSYYHFAVQQEAHYYAALLRGDYRAYLETLENVPQQHGLVKKASNGLNDSSERIQAVLSGDQYSEICQAATNLGVSSLTILVSAFELCLALVTNKESFLLGLVTSSRPQEDFQSVVGCFTNAFVFASHVDRDLYIKKYIEKTSETLSRSFLYRHIPFESIVEELSSDRSFGVHPLFQIGFNYLYGKSSGAGGSVFRAFSSDNAKSRFDLDINLQDAGNQLVVGFTYNSSIFDATYISDIHSLYIRFIEKLCQETNVTIRDLFKSFGAIGDYPYAPQLESSSGALYNRLINYVSLVSSKAAVIEFGDELRLLTYQELLVLVTKLKRYFSENYRLKAGQGVCLYLTGRVNQIVSILALWSLALHYIPIHTRTSKQHKESIVRQSRSVLMLTDESIHFDLGSVKSINIDEILSAPGFDEEGIESLDSFPGCVYDGSELAYILFTSGSTGTPKGVKISQSALASFADAYSVMMTDNGLSNIDRHLWNAHYTFDVSLEGLVHLCLGGTLIVQRQQGVLDKRDLLRAVETLGATVVDITPSHLKAICSYNSGALEEIPIKACIVAGEKIEDELWLALRKQAQENSKTILTAYGPTEATVLTTYANVLCAERSVLGQPMANTGIAVLDEDGSILPRPAVGELAILGSGLSEGYLDLVDLTCERFKYNANLGAKVYLTGDRVYADSNNNLFFIGRSDGQIKWRGFRLEKNEIERAFLKHEDIRDVHLTLDRIADEYHLIAYYCSSQHIEPEALQRFLTQNIDEYAVPSRFVHVVEFPRNPSGKLDEKALENIQQPHGHNSSDEQYEILDGPGISQICILFEEHLGLECCKPNDGFFEKGGHSLIAIRLISDINALFHVNIPLYEVWRNSTPIRLSALIGRYRSVGIHELIASAELKDGQYPASSAQRRFYWLSKAEHTSASYTIPVFIKSKRHYSDEAIKQVLKEFIAKHEILHTIYVEDSNLTEAENHIIKAHVIDQYELPIEIYEYADEDLLGFLSEHRNSLSNYVFDLNRELPIKLVIVKSIDEYHILFALHHIAVDEFSIRILSQVFMQLLSTADGKEGSIRGKLIREKHVPYSSYAAAENRYITPDGYRVAELYWKEQLSNVGSLRYIDYDRRGREVHNKAIYKSQLECEAYSALVKALSSQDLSLFILVHATMALTLMSLRGLAAGKSEKIVVGTINNNRDFPGAERIIGCLISSVLVATDFTNVSTVRELLNSVKSNISAAFRNGYVSLENALQYIPAHVRQDTPQVFIDFTNAVPVNTEGVEDYFDITEAVKQVAKMDLQLKVYSREGRLDFNWVYDKNKFSNEIIDRFVRLYERVLKALLNNLDMPVIDMIADDHLQGKNKVPEMTGKPVADSPGLVYQGLLDNVQTNKNNTAIYDSENAINLSWAELDGTSSKVALSLQEEHGVSYGDAVLLCLDRSYLQLVAIFAIWKLNAFYVPVDVHIPREKKKRIIENLRPKLIISNQPVNDADNLIIDINDLLFRENVAGLTGTHSHDSFDIAYIMHTSGTTGMPKGVTISHGNLLALQEQLLKHWKSIGLDVNQKFLWNAEYYFDVSLIGILALCAGYSLVIVPQSVRLSRTEFEGFCRRYDGAFIDLTPSHMDLLKSSDSPFPVPASILAGEKLSMNLWQDCIQWNELDQHHYAGYGPTETTVIISLGKINCSQQYIGWPFENVHCQILNYKAQLLPEGIPGEMLIGGALTSLGYWNNARATAEHFIPDAWSGRSGARVYCSGDILYKNTANQYIFVGRNDRQVKVNGHRIELLEIESILSAHPKIKLAVVTLEEINNRLAMTAYYQCDSKVAVTNEDIWAWLGERVNNSHMPHYLVEIDEVPLTRNGKLNIKALPKPYAVKSGPRLAATNKERLLLDIWKRVFKRDDLHVDDDFYALGGNSMLSLALRNTAKKHGLELSLSQILKLRTVASIATDISSELPLDTVTKKAVHEKNQRECELSSMQKRMYRYSSNAKKDDLTYQVKHLFSLENMFMDEDELCNIIRHLFGVRLHQYCISEEAGLSVIKKYTNQTIELFERVNEVSTEPVELVKSKLWSECLDATGALLKVFVFNLQAGKWLIGLAHHHILLDGWSLHLLLKDLMYLLNNKEKFIKGETFEPMDQLVYNNIEMSSINEHDGSLYWHDYLSAHQFNYHKKNTHVPELQRLKQSFSAKHYQALVYKSGAESISMKALFLAIWFKALHTVAGVDFLSETVGVVFNNRKLLDDRAEQAIGMFWTQLPVLEPNLDVELCQLGKAIQSILDSHELNSVVGQPTVQKALPNNYQYPASFNFISFDQGVQDGSEEANSIRLRVVDVLDDFGHEAQCTVNVSDAEQSFSITLLSHTILFPDNQLNEQLMSTIRKSIDELL